MKINRNTVESFNDHRERFGDQLIRLNGEGAGKQDILMLEMKKGLFGSSGSFALPAGFISFKANGKLTKLKESKRLPADTVEELNVTARASYSNWTFTSGKEDFTVAFSAFHKAGFTIEPEYLKDASAILWNLLGRTLTGSVFAGKGLGDPDHHRKELEEARNGFMDADVLAVDPLRASGDPFAPWTGMKRAFVWLLAGTAVSGENNTSAFLELYSSLDGIWADMLERFVSELENYGGKLKTSETVINMVHDMFDHFGAVWYFRTIIMLNFAQKKAGMDQPSWKASLLAPRALDMAGRQKVELVPFPKLDRMREEVQVHRTRLKERPDLR